MPFESPPTQQNARWSTSDARYPTHVSARDLDSAYPARHARYDEADPRYIQVMAPSSHHERSEASRSSYDASLPSFAHRRCSTETDVPLPRATVLTDVEVWEASNAIGTLKPTASTSTLEPWTLPDGLDAYILPSPSDALLLSDTRGRRLCASSELLQTLCSLEDPDWPERDFRGRVSAVVTVSLRGRWFALVACKDEKSAEGIKTTIDDKINDLHSEYVERDALVAPHGINPWTLCEDVMEHIKSAGALVDACDAAKLQQSRPHVTADSRSSSNSGQTLHQRSRASMAIELPGSVAQDHRKMAYIPSNRKLAAHIGRWNAQQQQQQHSNDEAPKERAIITGSANSTAPAPQDVTPSERFDYIDAEKQACLLCQRQFKSMQVLHKHTLESELHKLNLQDASTCEAGQKRKADTVAVSQPSKMKRAGFAPVGEAGNGKTADGTAEAGEAAAYRDRALERRRVFGKETVVAADGSKAFVWKRSGSSTTASHDPLQKSATPRRSSPPTAATPLDESSVGGALLAKMGWQSGQGLGSNGEGRKAPVEAHVYAPGSGIGSNKSGGGQGRAAPPPTVEEYAAKRARLLHDGVATQRVERLRERFDEG